MHRMNYLYPCKGVTKDGKVIRGDIIAPTALIAKRNFKRSYHHKGIKNVKVGKKRNIGGH